MALPAADFTGIWVGQFEGRNGLIFDIAFQLTQNGSRLEGKQYGDYGSFKITSGSVSDSRGGFEITVSEQFGNQINETTYRYKLCLQGDELHITRERLDSRNAGNAGDVRLRGDGGQTLVLKRLL